VLCRAFNKNIDIALIQEPYVYGGLVRRLTTTAGKLVYERGIERPRTAILLKKHVKFLPLPQFACRDLVAVQVMLPTKGGWQEAIIASAYFPGDSVEDPPPEEVKSLIKFCRERNRGLILGCDANAHHKVWGSTDINDRGECLFEYLCQTNLDIVNRGREPTFVTRARQEVLDLTLATPLLSSKIANWHVSREASLSDHRHIVFDLGVRSPVGELVRIPKLTDWALYQGLLRDELEGSKANITGIEELNRASTDLHNTIHKAYESSCPIKYKKSSSTTSWWNQGLEEMRSSARRLFNRAKRTKCQEHWDWYRKALTDYNKELRRSKRQSWRSFCESISEFPVAARLQRVMARDHSNQIGHLLKANGEFTDDAGEMLELLLRTHFPGARIITTDDNTEGEEGIPMPHYPHYRGIKGLANHIFVPDRVRWAISSFKPHKAPGGDGIFPALLQKGMVYLLPHVVNLYKHSFMLGYIPKQWRQANVVFIPKGGGRSNAQPKSVRPISLTSFMLKGMEKVLDQYLRDEVLSHAPLHKNQHAYQKAKSTITALHRLVSSIERAHEAKEIALCAFMDIEGAFDNTSYDSIEEAANGKGFHPAVTNWIKTMLKERRVKATVAGESATIATAKGCPQGGVLSPLLWSVVVDDLLNTLTSCGYEVHGYADDIVITIRGQLDAIVSHRMQRALNITQHWCRCKGLRINPEKTTIVPFTKRRKLHLTAPSLDGTVVELKTEVKYLGVILDQKLSWNSHLEKVRLKAALTLQTCRRLLGRNWGLKPKMIYWSYTAIIRPMVTYAAAVWWPKTEQRAAQLLLQKIQRLACLSITGAMRTCPTAAMEALLDLMPLHIQIRKVAFSTAIRILNRKSMLYGRTGHMRILSTDGLGDIAQLPSDAMKTSYNFVHKYEAVYTDRETWALGGPIFKSGALQWYTDGSKSANGAVGIGISGPNCRLSIPMGKAPSIFQAEVSAINICAQINQEKGMKGATINILTDSRAAVRALTAYTCSSALVWECISNLKLLARDNRVTLWWIPGHEGIEGNEAADGLAKKGACSPPTGPEPWCGVTASYINGLIRQWENQQKSTYWSGTTGMAQAKKFITYSPQKTRAVLTLDKGDLATLMGLFSGHCQLRYHLSLIGKAEDDGCRFCMETAETAEHIMCACPAVGYLRQKLLGEVYITPDQIREMDPRRVVGLFKSLDLAQT
jgi:ribonuclease HI